MQQEIAIGSAIIKAKCPRCRRGDIFVFPLRRFLKFHQTNKNCPVCNLRFEKEPGFFFGAMYVSYAFVVAAIAVISLLLYYIFGDLDLWIYVSVINGVLVLFLPLIFRYSRVLYLYLFGGVTYEDGF